MQPEDLFLFACARQRFEARHARRIRELCAMASLRWPLVLGAAVEHQVAPLVYESLTSKAAAGLPVSDELIDRLKQWTVHNVFLKRQVAHNIEAALAFLADRSVDVMLIKGEALNVTVYDKPRYTRSGDIDLIFRLTRAEFDPVAHAEVTAFLERLGQAGAPYTKHFEYDYRMHHDVTMNDVLPIDAARVWRDARRTTVAGQPVFLMAPEDTLIAAAINGCRKRYFRLKALCDVAEIVDRMPELDWAVVADKARAYRCGAIVHAALAVADMTLGCRAPSGVAADLGVSPARRRIIDGIARALYARTSLVGDTTGRQLVGRRVTPTLLLTYATYEPRQTGRKIGQLVRQ